MDLKVAIDLHLRLIYLLCEPTDYDNAMGRIIAVNLAHWRKRQEKRQLQEKREYQGNVQEMIETTNEGKFEKFPPFSDRLCRSLMLNTTYMNSAFPRADWLSWMRIVEYYSPPRSHREKHGSLVAMVCQEEII